MKRLAWTMLTSGKALGLRHKMNLCSLLCCHSLAQREPKAGPEGCDLSLLRVTKGDVALAMAQLVLGPCSQTSHEPVLLTHTLRCFPMPPDNSDLVWREIRCCDEAASDQKQGKYLCHIPGQHREECLCILLQTVTFTSFVTFFLSTSLQVTLPTVAKTALNQKDHFIRTFPCMLDKASVQQAILSKLMYYLFCTF